MLPLSMTARSTMTTGMRDSLYYESPSQTAYEVQRRASCRPCLLQCTKPSRRGVVLVEPSGAKR